MNRKQQYRSNYDKGNILPRDIEELKIFSAEDLVYISGTRNTMEYSLYAAYPVKQVRKYESFK